MADRYLLETSLVDGYLMEDGLGVLILEQQAGGDVFFEDRHSIEQGMKPLTAAGMGGVLVE